ncbi:MAG TPA: HAMP domain-containing sensor histidine kinase [Candidatus Saccharimonadales bacterium]|nr:HAMP domain-containing sensor histidine kinase [Candidatus Saccharimonadales bacterium]
MTTYTIWENFIYSGSKESDDSLEFRQIFFVNIFSLLGFLSVLIFGCLHIKEGNVTVGVLELIGAEVFLLNLFLLRVNKNIKLSKVLLLITQAALLIMQLATGGIAHTGIYWYFTFPITAFFLMGRKNGVISNLLLCISILFTFDLAKFHTVTIVYSFIEIRQLLVILIIVSILVYVYQQAIEKALVLEKQLDIAKSEFIVLASHQLRTPISAIAWFSEMLLHGDAGVLKEEQKDHITQIYRSNKRMAHLVDAMLQASQLETGNFPIHSEQVNLAECSHKIFQEEIDRLGRAKTATLVEKYDPAISKSNVFIDPTMIKIIFQNLFSNALKYTPPNGIITIEIAVSKQKDAVHNASEREGVLLKIADTGYGIPVNQKGKIFSRLFRASNIKEKDTDGTGLGLYIIKLMMNQIGGKIWFQSQENKGTTFFVWVPKEKK